MSAIVKGSLNAIARDSNMGLAEAFLNADTIIIVDTSGSMAQRDEVPSMLGSAERRRAGSGLSRYQRACEELANLQGNLEGRIAVIAFSSSTVFCPDGTPLNLGGGTDLAAALEFVQVADGVVERFIVISDGWPDDAEKAIKIASTFTTKIDTIFIGPAGDAGEGFLRRLAAACKGQSMNIKTAQIAEKVERLMLGTPA
jgi:Mg-chelatase subunit ChlD